jgi:hypothetical protein
MAVLPLWLLGQGLAIALQWDDFRGSHLLKRQALQTAAGTIVSSKITHRYRTDYYQVAYEFVLDGIRYRSEHVTFGYKGGYALAQEYVIRYPVGKRVTVYYEASNPSFSVLEPETRIDYLVRLWAPFVFIISCGAIAYLFMPRKGLDGKPWPVSPLQREFDEKRAALKAEIEELKQARRRARK